MARTLHVAFVWHMHQPLYKDRASGRYLMPWARLHATKDYLDVPAALEAFPAHRQTFNLVPSLLEQLGDYAAGATDAMLEVLMAAPADLTTEQKLHLFERGFDAHHATMIAPHRRYAGLAARREALRHMPPRRALSAFDDRDWGDLAVWFNLAWFDPTWRASEPVLRALVAKGEGFDAADRAALVALIRDYAGRVVPAYKAWSDAGRIELTTTPYYHPILPLLCETASARVARPELALPGRDFRWPADAEAQLARGLTAFEGWFGKRPQGLWPSEQAVSPQALALIAKQGIRWTLSDEHVLGRTLGRRFGRDAYGVTPDAALLYRPWRVRTPEGPVDMVFRDVALSDLIGFTYANQPAELAAGDLHQRLDRIRRLLPDGEAHVVTIALDGENCWEHYPEDGGPFLAALYQRIDADPALHMVSVGEFLAAHPPKQALATIHTGSWIGADLTTWIGDPTKNLAWEALAAARQAFAEAEARLAGTPELAEAREELFIAEGSDWFWWYGEGHDSGQDEHFDAQFRLHLQRLYALLGLHAPDALDAPIAVSAAALPGPGMPAPVLDGELGGTAWRAAAAFDPTAGQGAMHQAARAIARVLHGADHDTLYVGVALADGFQPGPDDELGLYFYHPGLPRQNAPLPYAPGETAPATAGFQFSHAVRFRPDGGVARVEEAGEHGAWHVVGEPGPWVCGRALEAAIPLRWLDAADAAALRMVVVVARGGRIVECAPTAEGLAVALAGATPAG